MKPITRVEKYLSAIAGEGELPKDMKPNTREEQYLSAIAGETELPKGTIPITREEKFLQKILDNGDGGGSHAMEDALIQNTAMNEYYNDRVTDVKYYGFVKSNIKVINLPNVTKIDNSAFDGINVSLIDEIYIPNCVTYGVSSFQRNPNLKIVDFGKGNVNMNGRINNCPMLTTLILRNENNLISPTSATAIQNCPFAPDGAGGYVYVPQALLSQYQASQDWTDYANVIEFRPIEGSIYELE